MPFSNYMKNRKFRFTVFSTGKMFDPRDQERTDAIDDFVKKDNEGVLRKLRNKIGIIKGTDSLRKGN